MIKKLLLLLLTVNLYGADIYVSSLGNDSNPGTQNQPLLTVNRAVFVSQPNDVILLDGDFDEYVQTTKESITIDGQNKSNINAFRARHPGWTVRNLQIRGAQNLWSSHVRIELAANNTRIINCHIGPGVYVESENFSIDNGDNSFNAPDVDFLAAGFRVGGLVYHGASGLERNGVGLWYDNHDKPNVVSQVFANKLVLQNDLAPESVSTFWAPIFAGQNHGGISGVLFVKSGGDSADNCRIENCFFDDLLGPSLDIRGDNHLVLNNRFSSLTGHSAIRANCSESIFRRNFFYNARKFLYYTQEETGLIEHPAGTGWYDYVAGYIHVTEIGHNNLFDENCFYNIHSPLGQINEIGDAYKFTFRNNLFIGVAQNLSGGRNGLEFINNTFYKCSFDYPMAAILTVGGNIGNSPQEDLVIFQNAFVNIGSRFNIGNEGFYNAINLSNPLIDFNFVTGPETLGYPAKNLNESNGFNGGDPLFVNEFDPLGPDGVPFTADDGLIPMPNSVLAVNNIGALPASNLTLVAHFRISGFSSGFGWYDEIGENYDSEWWNEIPYKRNDLLRPWDTLEIVDNVLPVTVEFNAGASFGNVVEYIWNFGDGGEALTSNPVITHQYNNAGKKVVQLTVKAGDNTTHAVQREYVIVNNIEAPVFPAPSNLKLENYNNE